MTTEGYVVSLDCSTTATKAVVWDGRGRPVAEGRQTFDLSRPRPGWHEQDAEQWRTSTMGAVAAAVSQVDADRVRAIGITHQRESFVCLDDSGTALRPAILWVDSRASKQIAEHGSDRLHELSGKPPDVTPALYKLLWLRDNEPDVLDRASMVADVHGYLVHAFTGGWITSRGSADPLGLVDMRDGGWSDELLDLVGLEAGQLPGVVDPGEVTGELTSEAAKEVGLPAGLPVIAGLGDGQSAGLGAGVTGPGRAYLNLGTAMVAGTYADAYRYDRAFRTMFGGVPGTYIYETLLSAGTYMVSWYVEHFGGLPRLGLGLSDEQVLEAAAGNVAPGADGLLLVPYWNASQTPNWDPLARGIMFGWHGSHGKAHFYRAIMEGVSYELRLQTEGVDAVLDTPIDRFYAMGGGSRSALWAQMVSDVTRKPVALCRATETTALGAGILAAAAVGLTGTTDIRETTDAMTGIARTVEPTEQRSQVYDRFYDVYRELYGRLSDLYPRLDAAVEHVADQEGVV